MACYNRLLEMTVKKNIVTKGNHSIILKMYNYSLRLWYATRSRDRSFRIDRFLGGDSCLRGKVYRKSGNTIQHFYVSREHDFV